MKRFISNYTILTSGKEYINHITTITDDNKLLSIEPFDRELGNTRYVPTPLCVTTSDHYNKVKENNGVFEEITFNCDKTCKYLLVSLKAT